MRLRVREEGLASLHLCSMSFCWLSRMPYLHSKAKKQKAMHQEEQIFQAPRPAQKHTLEGLADVQPVASPAPGDQCGENHGIHLMVLQHRKGELVTTRRH